MKTKLMSNCFRLATAVFRKALPADLMEHDTFRLIRLRDDLADERRKFQDRIASLAKDLNTANSEDALAGRIERQAQAVADEIELAGDKIRNLGFSLCQGLFSVSAPSYVTARWGFDLNSHPAVFGSLAIAASIVGVKYAFDLQSAHKSNPLSYLLSVNRALTPSSMAKDIVTLNLNGPDDDDDPRNMLAYAA